MGSSIDLATRVRSYIHKSTSNRLISQDIQQYGFTNFNLSLLVVNSLTICYKPTDIARIVIILEQYFIIKYNSSLNIVKIAGGVWAIPVVTAEKRAILKSKYNIPTYVYFNGVVIAIAESGMHLSKITGIGRSTVSYYTSGKNNSSGILYDKFVLSRDVPSANTPIQLLGPVELLALFNDARAVSRTTNYQPNSTSITVVDTLSNDKQHLFSSVVAASKFTSTYPNRFVPYTTILRKISKHQICKGWLFL